VFDLFTNHRNLNGRSGFGHQSRVSFEARFRVMPIEVLSRKEEAAVAEPEPVAAALTRDLRDFRAVSDIVRKYGGFWSSERRMFIVRKTR